MNHAPNHRQPKHRLRIKPKIIARIILAIIILTILINVANFFFGKPTLKVTTAPASAQIFVNEVPYNPRVRLVPGETYRIIVAAPGYIPQSFPVTPRRFQPVIRNINLTPIRRPNAITSNISSLFVNRTTGDLVVVGNDSRIFYRIRLLPNNSYITTEISKDIVPALKEPPILSPDFLLAIFRQTNGGVGLFDFKLYDLQNQEYHDWGGDIGDVAWRSDGERLVYVYAPPSGERSLIKSDLNQISRSDEPASPGGERIFDLRPERIINPDLEWSEDQAVITMVAGGNLYFLDPLTKILTKVVVGGVTSAKLSPSSRQVAYTQNGKLYLLNYEPVDPFSTSPKDRENIGRIIIRQPVDTGLKAEAQQTVFSKDSKRLLAIATNHIYEIFSSTGVAHQVTSNEGGKVSAVEISNDGNHLYVVIDDTLYDWYTQQ